MFIKSLYLSANERQYRQFRRIADADRQPPARAETAADIELRSVLHIKSGVVAGEELVMRAEHAAESRQSDNAAVRVACKDDRHIQSGPERQLIIAVAEGKSYYLVYQPVGFQHLSIVGIVGRGVVDSGMRKIQNATILLLAGLFFCAGIVLVHGVRTDARLRVEEKERALRQEGEARQQMEDLANTDGLTGLYNERYFDALLKENELNRTPFVLFYLDLDRFKPVNDRYGHDVGDQLLKEVASRLRGCVRESDAVFRIGGDEFALIVNGAVTEGFCKSRVEKIKAAIREPYRLKDAEVQVSTSCGCAVYPCDSDDVRAIRILADHRMYEDKQRSGRS